MKTFEDFFLGLPENEKKIVTRLRQIVLETAPVFQEKISYGVPYYFLNTRVCFIWPSSIKPGPKSGVAFGLCKGHLLSDEQGIIEMGTRKEVGMIIFHSESDIQVGSIREIINEAILVDQITSKKKKGKPKDIN